MTLRRDRLLIRFKSLLGHDRGVTSVFTTKRKEWGKIVRDQEAKMRSRDSGCIESFTSRQRSSLYFNTFALHVQDKRCTVMWKSFQGTLSIPIKMHDCQVTHWFWVLHLKALTLVFFVHCSVHFILFFFFSFHKNYKLQPYAVRVCRTDTNSSTWEFFCLFVYLQGCKSVFNAEKLGILRCDSIGIGLLWVPASGDH